MTAAVRPSTVGHGRGWAYAGALLGAGVSVAANVAHSYVPPSNAPAGWHPHVGAVVGAVFWPVALLVAIEVLARVAWPAAGRWLLVRFGGLGPVAVVAAVVSYRHLSGLLAFYGEDGITCTVGPLAVDGLMIMATGALLATGAAVTERSTTARGRTADTGKGGQPDTGTSRQADSARTGQTDRRTPARDRVSQVGRVDTSARVAALRGRGLSAKEIATQLGVTERTVRRHAARQLAQDTTSNTGEVSA